MSDRFEAITVSKSCCSLDLSTISVPHTDHAPAKGTLGGEAAAAAGLRLFADLEDPGAMAFTAAISSCGVAKEWESLDILLADIAFPKKDAAGFWNPKSV